MASGSDLLREQALRILIVGYPGSAKTGMLASLLNAGFKMRFLDFDGNIAPLLRFTDKSKLDNLDAVFFEDKMRASGQFMEPVGIPTAFADALKMMDHWKYTTPAGELVDLGQSKDWGLDTIVVLDSLGKMGDAAYRRSMKLQNKTPLNSTDRVYFLAMNEQQAFIEKLTSPNNKFHVIVLSHLKMIAPKDVRNGDTDLTKDLKQQVADILPTRLYPNALGWQLPQTIGGEFPTLLEAKLEIKAGKTRRTINAVPRSELDLKFPALGDVPSGLDISDGMLKVFQALSPESVALVSKPEGQALSAPETERGST